jgi:hypothetical protein
MGNQIEERLPTLEQILMSRCMNMVVRNKVCPASSIEELANVIIFSHKKGYLLTNRKANAFVCCYRIPEINDRWKNEIPENEQGDILYVNFAVSESADKWILLKILRDYMKENPDVKELVYYRRGSNTDFKKIHLRSQS